jgi:small subunit ribosomal protein S3e
MFYRGGEILFEFVKMPIFLRYCYVEVFESFLNWIKKQSQKWFFLVKENGICISISHFWKDSCSTTFWLKSNHQKMPKVNISQKRKHVADGVQFAELNEFFTRELAEDGYSGVEVRATATKTEIVVRATHTQNVLGENGRRIRELTSLVQKRFKMPDGSVAIYAERVQQRGLSAVAQCESLRYKLLNGLAIRRAAYGVVRYVMESGAKGVEVVISGKLRAARAKAMKFQDGFMIHSGQPVLDFIDTATRHVLLRQGVLGIKVKIMRDPAADSKPGAPKSSLPDFVNIHPPKEETAVAEPNVIVYTKPAAPAAPADAAPEEPAAEAEPVA